MSQQFFNNADTASLLSAISAGAVSFTLQSGEGAGVFPLDAGNHFYATFNDGSTIEVVKVTARSADIFTCEATTNAFEAGTGVAQFVTAEMMGDMAQIDGDGQVLQDHELRDYSETSTSPASSSSVLELDLENGNVFAVTLTEDVTTLNLSNPPASGKAGSITIILAQDATGGWAFTWPASVKWAGGTAPTLTTTAGSIDIITLLTVDGGTTWYGMLAGGDFA